MYYVISLDIGTTGCKCMLFDARGNIVGSTYLEYPLIVHSDKEIEQDAELWWHLSLDAISCTIRDAKINSAKIMGICVSSQGISFVPVDKNINVLDNAISWLDTRAEEETLHIVDFYDKEKFFNITGKRLNAGYMLPKLMWLKSNKPHIYQKAYKFLMPHDFVVARLTGNFFTDHTLASGTAIYDINNLSWNNQIIETFNIDKDKLPDIKWSGEFAGYLSKSVAKQTGLDENVGVYIGGQDQKIAALGINLDKKTSTISLGTAGAMEFILDNPMFDKKMELPCFTYTKKGQWVLEAVIATAGASIKWARNTLFNGLDYKSMDKLAESTIEGSNGVMFYPHLAGAGSPIWNTNIRGMFYGISLNTNLGDIARSILEGIAFQFKSNIVKAESLGLKIDELKIFGGGSRSDIFCEIISNVTGRKIVSYYSPEIASLGAGYLAAKGCGIYQENFGETVLQNGSIYSPKDDLSKKYDSLYKERYTKLENAMCDTVDQF